MNKPDNIRKNSKSKSSRKASQSPARGKKKKEIAIKPLFQVDSTPTKSSLKKSIMEEGAKGEDKDDNIIIAKLKRLEEEIKERDGFQDLLYR